MLFTKRLLLLGASPYLRPGLCSRTPQGTSAVVQILNIRCCGGRSDTNGINE